MRILILLAAATAVATARPCTIFFVNRGGQVLMGANEDMVNKAPWDKHWVQTVPARKEGELAYIGFGYNQAPFIAQAAMNEAGLFFDFNALPALDEGPKGKPVGSLLVDVEMLHTCRTVKEVVELFSKYDMVGFSTGQMVIGDATGDSAIIERNAITYRGKLDYQIGTNFRTSTTKKEAIDCWRYKSCDATLSQGKSVTLEAMRQICQDTMPKTSEAISWWTTVCDLKAAKILLFRKGDFSKAVTIDMKTAIGKTTKRQDLDEFMKSAQPYRP